LVNCGDCGADCGRDSPIITTTNIKAQMLLQNPNASATAEAKDLVNKVGKLMVLHYDRNANYRHGFRTSINWPARHFFANAQNGDKC